MRYIQKMKKRKLNSLYTESPPLTITEAVKSSQSELQRQLDDSQKAELIAKAKRSKQKRQRSGSEETSPKSDNSKANKSIKSDAGVKMDNNNTSNKTEECVEAINGNCSTLDELDSLLIPGATQTMDLKTFITMFKQLKAQFSSDMENLRRDVVNAGRDTVGKQEILTNAITETNKTIHQLRDELETYKATTKILLGSMERTNLCMTEMKQKLDRMDLNASKRMLMLTGFYASDKKETRFKQLYNFFHVDMGTDVVIEDVFAIGEVEPKQLVITFDSVTSKKEIFRNIGKVKDYVNKDGRRLIFKDYLPSQLNEQRRRENDIIAQNEKKEGLDKLTIDKVKGGISVNSALYRKKVEVPDPTKILQMPEDELNEILQMKINAAPNVIREENNSFSSYSIPASNLEEVRKAYMAIKLSDPGARHIVGVWRLPGGGMDHELNDYQDDEDFGVGRNILEMLQDNQITHRAIFVARYTSTENLGAKRFVLYCDAVKAIIRQAPYNSLCQEDQVIKDVEYPTESYERKRLTDKTNRKHKKGPAGNKVQRSTKVFHPTDQATAKNENSATQPKFNFAAPVAMETESDK